MEIIQLAAMPLRNPIKKEYVNITLCPVAA
jgi:hypothetical protein